MRRFLIILVLGNLLSTVSAIAQSMLVLKSGKVLTIDRGGVLYDKGDSVPLNKLKRISKMGGRFMIDQDRTLWTVDVRGNFYRQEKDGRVPPDPEDIIIPGNNFLITKTRNIFIINDQGSMIEAPAIKDFKKPFSAGGNWFVAEMQAVNEKKYALFVVKGSGAIVEVKVPGLKPEIISGGGRGFMTGYPQFELFTTSMDGQVFSRKELGRFEEKSISDGHNYMVVDDQLLTFSVEGSVFKAGPLKRKDDTILGDNFILHEGKLMTIDAQGKLKTFKINFKSADVEWCSRHGQY